jgi:hypothetical protein
VTADIELMDSLWRIAAVEDKDFFLALLKLLGEAEVRML